MSSTFFGLASMHVLARPSRLSLTSRRRRLGPLILGALLGGLTACNDGGPTTPVPATPIPASLAIRSGADQRQVAGTLVATPLGVVVRDGTGAPVRDVQVRFQTADGSAGTVLDTLLTTSATGEAAARFRLGQAPGEGAYVVEARLPAHPRIPAVRWRLTGLQGTVTQLLAVGDTVQTVPAGDSLVLLRLQARSATGLPLDGVPVTWQITGPGALADSSQGLTDPAGLLQMRVRPLGTPGALRVTATVAQSGTSLTTTWRLAVPARGDLVIDLPGVDAPLLSGSPLVSRLFGGGAPARLPAAPAARRSDGRGRPDSTMAVLRIPTGPSGRTEVRAWLTQWSRTLAPLREQGLVTEIDPQPLLGIVRVRLAPWQPLSALIEALQAAPATREITVRPLTVGGRRRMRLTSAELPPLLSPAGELALAPGAWRQQWAWHQIGLADAWQAAPKRGRGIRIGVVDDGIRYEHPSLAPVLTRDGYDFVSDGLLSRCDGGVLSRTGDGGGYDPDPTQPIEYQFIGDGSGGGCVGGQVLVGGHGLQVMSALGGMPGLAGAFGVAPEARMRPVRAFDVAGGANEVDIANAILYAAGLPVVLGGQVVQASEGLAQILNLSYAGPEPWALEAQAIGQVQGVGVLVVAAAGNTGDRELQYPAALGGVIGVSSTDPAGGVPRSATRGPWVKVLAPGGACGAVDGTPEAAQVWLAEYDFLTKQPRWGWTCGTSYAAPVVAGLAALVWAEEPAMTANMVRAKLLTATRQDALVAGASETGRIDARLLWPTPTEAPQYDVVAVSARDGQVVARMTGAGGGSVTLRQLAAGAYHVLVQPRDAAGRPVDLPSARSGAVRDAQGRLEAIAVTGGTTVRRAASMMAPTLRLDRDTLQLHALLPLQRAVLIDGLTRGQTGLATVQIPQAGRYRLQLQGEQAGCGVLGQGHGVITLTTLSGTVVGSAVPPTLGGCSQMTVPLTPGAYRISVSRTQDGPLTLRMDGPLAP